MLHAVKGFVDLIHPDHFALWQEIFLGAEVEHVPSFMNSANGRTRNAAPNGWAYYRASG